MIVALKICLHYCTVTMLIIRVNYRVAISLKKPYFCKIAFHLCVAIC